MTWMVYLLRCRDGELYCGVTNNLTRRLAQHNAGKGARYTASRLPVVLAWWKPVATRSLALCREARIKRLTRQQKLELVRSGGCPE